MDTEQESRLEFQNRLKRENRWAEIHIWIRNAAQRIKHKHKELTNTEALEEAYQQAMRRCPNSLIRKLESESETEEDIVHIAATKGSMDVAGDVEWAYKNLNNKQVRADQAPSAGAWNMLQYGRQVRHKFLELVAKYDSQIQKEKEKDAEDYELDAAGHIKAIQKLRKITERIHADEIRDAIRQCPDEVVTVLNDAGWTVIKPSSGSGAVNTPQTTQLEATGGSSSDSVESSR